MKCPETQCGRKVAALSQEIAGEVTGCAETGPGCRGKERSRSVPLRRGRERECWSGRG